MPPLEEMSREELVALVVAQAETIAGLQTRIAALERKSSRNPGNSSLPPSTDDAIPGRPRPERRVRTGKPGRKRGKQPGADGTSAGLGRERGEGGVPAGRPVRLRG